MAELPSLFRLEPGMAALNESNLRCIVTRVEDGWCDVIYSLKPGDCGSPDGHHRAGHCSKRGGLRPDMSHAGTRALVIEQVRRAQQATPVLAFTSMQRTTSVSSNPRSGCSVAGATSSSVGVAVQRSRTLKRRRCSTRCGARRSTVAEPRTIVGSHPHRRTLPMGMEAVERALRTVRARRGSIDAIDSCACRFLAWCHAGAEVYESASWLPTELRFATVEKLEAMLSEVGTP